MKTNLKLILLLMATYFLAGCDSCTCTDKDTELATTACDLASESLQIYNEDDQYDELIAGANVILQGIIENVMTYYCEGKYESDDAPNSLTTYEVQYRVSTNDAWTNVEFEDSTGTYSTNQIADNTPAIAAGETKTNEYVLNFSNSGQYRFTQKVNADFSVTERANSTDNNIIDTGEKGMGKNYVAVNITGDKFPNNVNDVKIKVIRKLK